MNQLREASQQALEALNYWDRNFPGTNLNNSAIENLTAALALPDAQPVIAPTEPVAWMYDWQSDEGEVQDWLTSNYEEAHNPSMGCQNIRHLYTQSQPISAPLSDREIIEIAHRACTTYRHTERLMYAFTTGDLLEFARAINKGKA